MRKQFTKKSFAVAVIAAVLAFPTLIPVGAAGQSENWFEQQRSLTDGVSTDAQPSALSPRMAKGAKSRVGEPAVSPEGEACSNQERQLRDAFFSSDGIPYAGSEGNPRC